MSVFDQFAKATRAGQRQFLERAVRNFQNALLTPPGRTPSLADTKSSQFGFGPLRYLVPLWVFGAIGLAFATWACLQLGLTAASTVLVYLIVTLLLSLLDSAISSVVFSVITVAFLNYFFVAPLHSFDVANSQDLIALFAFLITSLAITGPVRRVRHLGEAQREQALLLDLTHDSFIVRDTSDVIAYWSRGAEQLYGWRKEDAMGKVAHELLQTVFPAPIEEIQAAVSRTGRWEGELLHTSRYGARVCVASRWSLQTDAFGKPVGTLETNTDITNRKRAEDALRRSQAAYLAEAQKLSHTGSFGWNVSSGELFWSDETFRIFELDPAEPPSIEFLLRRVHPEDRALVEQVIEEATTRKKAFDFEHRLLMPDGSVKTLHVIAHVLIDEPGKLQFAGAVMDVTERRKIEEALQYSEHRYHSLFQAMAASFWELDISGVNDLLQRLREEGVVDFRRYFTENPGFIPLMLRATRVVDVNDETVLLFGRGRKQELLGDVEAFWPEESRQAYVEGVLSGIVGEPNYSAETKMRRLDGSHVDVLFTTACNPREARRRGTILVGIIDLSERNRAKHMLQRVQADFAHAARVSVLGELTASIAHELNQPLAAIATSGEASLRWLDQPEPDVDEVRASITRMLMDARRASDIIGRVREMAAGRGPECTPLSLDDVIREALLFLRHEIQERGVTVSQQINPGSPQVLGDRTQLQQVVVNLAVNAMQAMAQAGTADCKLTFRTAIRDKSSLCCIVEDSGPGISRECLPRLFDSFFTTKDSGMGMGLSICRSIIEAHGGTITADNKAAHGGARICFTLPAERPTAERESCFGLPVYQSVSRTLAGTIGPEQRGDHHRNAP